MPKGIKNSGKKRNSYNVTKCVIGVDQSYTCTGLAIAVEGQLKVITSDDFKGSRNKSLRRMKVANNIEKAIKSCLKHYPAEEITIIVERIRTFSQGHAGDRNLSISFIKAQASLVSVIVDTAYKYGVKVYSVDTRAWKTAILGTADPLIIAFEGVKNPKKIREVKYICELGFESKIKKKGNRGYRYDDDAADAACIALYGTFGGPYKLLLEE